MAKSILLLAGLAALCAVPATAQTMSIPVSFSGLDLNSATGQDVLNRRVDRAAKSVCGTFSADTLAAQTAAHKCLSTTLAMAQSRVAIAIAASQQGIQTAAR
jgi:UrcA family protein